MEEEVKQEEAPLFTGVRGLAVKILNRIDRTDAYLDKLLDTEIKQSDFSGVDKALLFELVHGVMRMLNRIDWVLNGFYKGQFSKAIPNIKNALRVALYQILFLEKIPDYAAVNEAVEFIKKAQGQKAADLTNAILRNIIRSKDTIRYPDPAEDITVYFSVFYSHPIWLVKRWLNRYGQEFTEQLLISNNNKPTLNLRVNSLVTNIDELKSLLDKVELKYKDGLYLNDFLRMANLSNIADWEYFAKGYFSIQDESTGIPVSLLDVKPGDRILDLCAAPGGKTAYMSAKTENKGEIVALDKYESRIKVLQKNLSRLKVSNVKYIEADALEYKDSELFDKILLDAPCSGLGTLTKKPDLKWKRELMDLKKLADLQYKLLEKGASLLKIGGDLVYSTCTIEPEENNEIVNRFLLEHNGYVLESAEGLINEKLVTKEGFVQALPNIHGIDGSFSAKIKRIY
ncbi:MAG TPA: 16S rRNA (cytosine(967)-C(5))-methyltransferase RsmB [Melioribacteraceae bacterium]|nr:16S rRNA (cytosine(967)-C(5))-methyltransferase RsmB [Melioribacteraceae bacterium]